MMRLTVAVFMFTVACSTPFSPSVSEGIWLESDYTVEFNSACPASGIFQDSLGLTYQFGAASGYGDTGYWMEAIGLEAVQTYQDDLWSMCWSDSSDARVTCAQPALVTQYENWKENFPLETMREEQNCIVDLSWGYTDGVFIDDKTVRVVNEFEMTCTDSNGEQVLRTCASRTSSIWTKQQAHLASCG